MTLLGELLHRVRAGAHRSPLAGPRFDAPGTIVVTSTAFTDGAPMPRPSAGKGVGDNISPPLSWKGLPPETKQVVLIIYDIDVPLPRPLLHTIAVIEPGVDGIAEGALRPGSARMRFIPGGFGHLGYAGPRPIRGHGPHHYRFQVFALDVSLPDHVTTARAMLDRMAGHVLARGVLNGTYERPHPVVRPAGR